MAGSKDKGEGHPLPASDEARGYLIPEGLQEEKGLGDDAPGEDGGEDPRGSDKDVRVRTR